MSPLTPGSGDENNKHSTNNNNNNNNDFICANILKDQAQWHNKTKGLSKLVIVKQCMSHQWMDEEARRQH